MKAPKIEIKNLKQMDGHDGYVFSCTVYVDGKRSFTAHNDGWGGENWYESVSENGDADIKRCEEYAKTKTYEFMGETSAYNLDILIEDYLAEYEKNKQLKRWCKTKTVFKLPEYKDGEYSTIPLKYSPKTKEHILTKYPKAIIINEMFA